MSIRYRGGFITTSYNPILIADGSTSTKAAVSAAAIKALTGTNTDGVYWIDLPTVGPTEIYCIMNSAYDGGGWMLMMKATNSGTTFNYGANYWTTTNTLNPTDLTLNNADAKYNTMNYFAAKDIMARWPDITTGSGGMITGLGSWIWLENNFNNGNRVTPVDFFTNPSTYYRWTSSSSSGQGNFIGLAKSSTAWGGIFSSQNAVNFYGFNYSNLPNVYGTYARVRWGFGWNENGEGNFPSNYSAAAGSNDVSGGIGMDSTFGNYSAGDKINCCQDGTGINRQARVEVYVR